MKGKLGILTLASLIILFLGDPALAQKVQRVALDKIVGNLHGYDTPKTEWDSNLKAAVNEIDGNIKALESAKDKGIIDALNVIREDLYFAQKVQPILLKNRVLKYKPGQKKGTTEQEKLVEAMMERFDYRGCVHKSWVEDLDKKGEIYLEQLVNCIGQHISVEEKKSIRF